LPDPTCRSAEIPGAQVPVAIGRVGGVLVSGGDGEFTGDADDAANALAIADGLTPGKFACTGD
jgi:hypothetical protein